jgi:hypothetical protein
VALWLSLEPDYLPNAGDSRYLLGRFAPLFVMSGADAYMIFQIELSVDGELIYFKIHKESTYNSGLRNMSLVSES